MRNCLKIFFFLSLTCVLPTILKFKCNDNLTIFCHLLLCSTLFYITLQFLLFFFYYVLPYFTLLYHFYYFFTMFNRILHYSTIFCHFFPVSTLFYIISIFSTFSNKQSTSILAVARVKTADCSSCNRVTLRILVGLNRRGWSARLHL